MMVEAPTFGIPVREVPIYGSPSTGLYKFDDGGFLQPGITPVLNATGKPEPVFTGSQWDKIDELLTRQNSPSELTVVDVDGKLVGRMRVEAERVVIAASSDN
jgi:putative transglycosylase domain-containing protein